MSLGKDGIVVILSSPSGAGKTTLVKKIAQENNFKISISYTTRKPRTNEQNGKDYFFISDEEFENLIKNKQFLEYAKVFENYYGSSKSQVFENLNKGENVIFDIDWQGSEQIKKQKLNYKLITFFILPPSKSELFSRLKNRDMKDKNIVEERMKQFNEDIEQWENYDFVVINDDLEKCYNEIIRFINKKKESLDSNYDKNNILNHIKKLRT
jgi:guanylate kinase|tara:strand:- start:400 stop:1032 length:633 start_codon:yes stop_codon:yes gene_type:complete